MLTHVNLSKARLGTMLVYFNFILVAFVAALAAEGTSSTGQHGGELCGSRHCQHGTCVADGDDSRCNCSVGFIGDSCQFSDPCYSTRHHASGQGHGSGSLHSALVQPCLHGGRCVSRVAHGVGVGVGEVRYKCHCPAGFTGPHCQTIERCTCENGGVCTRSHGTKCRCVAPYYGAHCQCLNGFSTVDNSPCANSNSKGINATRLLAHADAHSRLAYNFFRTGRRSEASQASSSSELPFNCTRDVCLNNGSCDYDQSVGAYNCRCDRLKWKGKRCEAKVTCQDNPCFSGSTCVDVQNGYTCVCADGYAGQNCSINTNPCATCPQTCSKIGNTSACPCDHGKFGVFCNYTNYCVTNNRCRNNATCYPFIDGPISNYTCSCPPQFTGRDCDQDIDECELALKGSRPLCENDGTCINKYGSYECNCKPGYTGPRCDIVVDFCQPNPCLNGGTCLPQSGKNNFVCSCVEPYGGQTCNMFVTSTSTSTPKPTTASTTTTTVSTTAQWTYNDAMLSCVNANCANGPNGVCDQKCNSSACGYDNGDCAFGQTPFLQCLPFILHSVRCDLMFKNGECNPQCNNEQCLFDGYDCLFPPSNGSIGGQNSVANPAQCPAACVTQYANGVCNAECNNAVCAYDALDCAVRQPFADYLVLVLDVSYNKFSTNISLRNSYLLTLSWQLQLVVRLVSLQPVNTDVLSYSRQKREASEANTQLILSLDSSKCTADCVSSATTAAQLLAATNLAPSDTPLPIVSITTKQGTASGQPRNVNPFLTNPLAVAFTAVAALLVAVLITFGVIAAVRKAADAQDDDNRPSTSSSNEGDDQTVRESPSRVKVRARLWMPPFPGAFGLQRTGDSQFSRGNTASLQSQNSTATIFSNGTGETGETGTTTLTAFPAYDCAQSKRARLDKPKNPALRESMYEDEEDASNDERESDAAARRDRNKLHVHVRAQKHAHGHNQSHAHAQAATKNMTKAMVLATRGCGLELDSQIMPEDSISNVLQPDTSQINMVPSSVASRPLSGVKSVDALHDAIHDMVRNGVSLNARCDPGGETALHLACRYGQPPLVKQLLDCGADANAEDASGRTPLHTAIASDSFTCFSLLLKNRQTNLNAKTRGDSQTPLIVAVKLAINTEVVGLLIKADVDLNSADANGRTALHWAAAVNNLDAARQLLTSGANRDAQDQREQTPLFLSAREGSYEVAKLLLEESANPEIPDYEERTPRQVALERAHDEIVRLLDQYATVGASSCIRPNFSYNNSQHPYNHGAPTRAMPHLAMLGSSCRNVPQEVSNDRRNTMPTTCTNTNTNTNTTNKGRQKGTLKVVKGNERPAKASPSQAANMSVPSPTDVTSPSSAFTANNTPPSLNAFTSNSSAPNSTSNSPSHHVACSSLPIPVCNTGGGVQVHASRPAQLDHLLQQPSSAGSADSGYGHGSNSISPPHAAVVNASVALLNQMAVEDTLQMRATQVPLPPAASQAATASHNSSVSSTPSSVNPPTVINTYAVQGPAGYVGMGMGIHAFPRPPPAPAACASEVRAADGQQFDRCMAMYEHASQSQYTPSCNASQPNLELAEYNASRHGSLSNRTTVANGIQLNATYSMSVAYAHSVCQSPQLRAHQQHQQHQHQHTDTYQQRAMPRSMPVRHDSYSQEHANGQMRMNAEVQAMAPNPVVMSQRYPGFPATYI